MVDTQITPTFALRNGECPAIKHNQYNHLHTKAEKRQQLNPINTNFKTLMKKQYHIPTTRVVILDTEETILAVSGERADKQGELVTWEQRDYDVTKPWGENPWGNE